MRATTSVSEQTLLNATTAGPGTLKPTVHSVDISFVTSVLMCTLSASVFLLSCLLLLCYERRKSGAYIIESRIELVAFFIGTLLTTVTSLSAYSQEQVYEAYILLLEFTVGIGVLIAGSALLFDNPRHERTLSANFQPSQPIGHTHASMGAIIWVITIPLCVIEVFFAIAAVTKKPHPIYATVEFVSFVQKLMQTSVYHFSLRHKVPKSHVRMGCSWYLKILSLLNFAFWVDSIVTSQLDNQYIQVLFGKGFSIIKTSFNAFLIDYRLLCSMLFLEHAIEIEESSRAQIQGGYEVIHEVGFTQHGWSRAAWPFTVSHSSGYGYMIGLIWIGLQLVNGLQYFTSFVGNWTNLFPILADVFVILIGLWLLHSNRTEHTEEDRFKWRETDSKAMDVMVGFLGTISFVFWFMKAVLCNLWTVEYFNKSAYSSYHYLAWTSTKDYVRAFGIIFQLHFFIKMGPTFCLNDEPRRRRVNRVLVPAIMLVLLSLFVAAVIDQYDGIVEELLAKANLHQVIRVYFDVAAPVHLVFSLHMFLHFFIINKRMSQNPLPRRPPERVTEFSGDHRDDLPAPVTEETAQPICADSAEKNAVETEEEETTPLLAQSTQHQSSANGMSK